jgi:hypothetical protein
MFWFLTAAWTVVNATTTPINTAITNTSTSSIVEEIDQVFGTSSPIMVQVASCESGLREYDENTGKILRGIVNHDDVGVFQINIDHHQDEVLATTTNIYTAHGNILFAKYLFDQSGLQPWASSKSCWSKAANSG